MLVNSTACRRRLTAFVTPRWMAAHDERPEWTLVPSEGRVRRLLHS